MKLKMIKMEILAASIGKKSFSDNKIKENFDSLLQTILKEKPNGIKGNFILAAFLHQQWEFLIN